MSHRQRIKGAIIDALLARPDGMTVSDGCEACPETGVRSMCKRLQHLMNYSKAWNTKIPGSLAHRWFATQAARDAWAAANPPPPNLKELRAQRRAAAGPRLADRLMALVLERGSHGTLPADLSAAVGRRSGVFGSWATKMQRTGLLHSIKHKGVRILYPASIELSPSGLRSCQRRIDSEFVNRNRRGKYAVMPAKPGVPAGVTLPTKSGWRDAMASNDGQVTPTVCPAPRFDYRHQIDPLTRVVGGFATLGIGRYDAPASNAIAKALARGQAA